MAQSKQKAQNKEKTERKETPEIIEPTVNEKDAEIEALKKELAKKNAAEKNDQIKVRANARGYYDQLREEGEIFTIRKKEDMGSWMDLFENRPAEEAPTISPDKEITGDEEVI